VGVLGATGAVGQRFLQYLEGHPWFEVTSLGASERSAGKKYEDATSWQLTANLPDFVRGKTVSACSPAAMPNVDFVFSALVRDGVGQIVQVGRARWTDCTGAGDWRALRRHRLSPALVRRAPSLSARARTHGAY